MGGVDPNNFENFRNQMKEETLSDKIRGYRRRSIIDVCEVKEFIRKIKELIEFYENNSDWKMPDKLKLEIYKLAGSSLIHSSQIPNSQRVGLQPEDTPGVRNPPRERQRGEASGTQSCENCGHDIDKHCKIKREHNKRGSCYSCKCKKFIPRIDDLFHAEMPPLKKTTDKKGCGKVLDVEDDIVCGDEFEKGYLQLCPDCKTTDNKNYTNKEKK